VDSVCLRTFRSGSFRFSHFHHTIYFHFHFHSSPSHHKSQPSPNQQIALPTIARINMEAEENGLFCQVCLIQSLQVLLGLQIHDVLYLHRSKHLSFGKFCMKDAVLRSLYVWSLLRTVPEL
jgi:hypothetical protein